MRRSALIAGVLGAGLVFAASGSLGLKVGFDQLGNLPEGAPSVRGYEELTEEYPEAYWRRSTCWYRERT
jgi:hypothetical protein